MSVFGEQMRQARQARGLSLRALAARLPKPDGAPVSIVYLSDIERGRRDVNRPWLIAGLNRELGIGGDTDLELWRQGRLPTDVTTREYQPEQIAAALSALRSSLEAA